MDLTRAKTIKLFKKPAPPTPPPAPLPPVEEDLPGVDLSSQSADANEKSLNIATAVSGAPKGAAAAPALPPKPIPATPPTGNTAAAAPKPVPTAQTPPTTASTPPPAPLAKDTSKGGLFGKLTGKMK